MKTNNNNCYGNNQSYSNRIIIKRNGGITPKYINSIGGNSANYK